MKYLPKKYKRLYFKIWCTSIALQTVVRKMKHLSVKAISPNIVEQKSPKKILIKKSVIPWPRNVDKCFEITLTLKLFSFSVFVITLNKLDFDSKKRADNDNTIIMIVIKKVKWKKKNVLNWSYFENLLQIKIFINLEMIFKISRILERYLKKNVWKISILVK